jgi:hypothetical protein
MMEHVITDNGLYWFANAGAGGPQFGSLPFFGRGMFGLYWVYYY